MEERVVVTEKSGMAKTAVMFVLGVAAGALLMALLVIPRDAKSEAAKNIENTPAVDAQFEKFKKDMDVAFPHLAQRVGNMEQMQGKILNDLRAMAFNYLVIDKAMTEKFGKDKWTALMDESRQAIAQEVAESQKKAQPSVPVKSGK